MDASSLLALPTFPAPTGLQNFALFINFFFPALALLVVSVRVAGRVAASQFAADDWLVCVAMLMSVAETIISFFFIKTNFIGIPREQVPSHDPTQGLIWSYAVQILYNPILALVKSSVLIFLTGLFGQKDWVRRSLLWLNVANISQMVAVFFAIVLQCTPVAFNWDPTISGGHCVDRRVLYLSTSVFNIVTDLIILGLPLWVFSSLRIPKRTKIALLVVFLLGFLVTLTSTVRMVILIQGLFNLSIFPNSASNNVGFVTSAIETNLALITASAPALRPIFRSRDRGGWFARSVMATTTGGPSSDRDLEANLQKRPFGWDNRTSTSASSSSPPASGLGSGGSNNVKFGRGGSRGGRKPGTTRRGRARSPLRARGSGKLRPTIVRLKTERDFGGGGAAAVELRSSPRSSEEQAMTSNGIVRVSDIQREIDGIVKDIAVAGQGTYTGGAVTTTTGVVGRPPRAEAVDGDDYDRGDAGDAVAAAAEYQWERVRRGPPERYYSESIYPEQGMGNGDDWDDDDRVSRYLDRRFGVVTPKGTTPTSKGGGGSGRPF
ncbi:hypothetical protein NEMBOFW57_000732 [Staphylotrichum longicolle]|uniref:Rhodopsin domain-containing protein n=1 Tax=Staphylotrichum longicolle TaxID=669026 RepID=A0AAD4F083_9PEZI|nr:hypothetical protein NEMBOFW57_000732 [Staphylotrichum longicolle]